jgi:hypothetical protein
VSSGVRVGRPAPVALVASYFGAALLCWLAAAAALVAAAEQLANEGLASQEVLLAVHLVGLSFLPLAVTGAALHVLPTLLRNDVTAWRGWAALPLLCAGPVLAYAIAHDLDVTTWLAAAAVALGFVLVAWEIGALVARAPRGRMLLASRFGVAASTFHAGAALVVGAALADRGWRPLFGIPPDRVIAIHLHLAVIGWLTLLIVTVGRTLTPMLSLAPAEPRRRLPVEELVLTAGLWLLLLGLALGWRVASAVGALLVLGAVVAFAVLTARIGRRHRLDGLEGPLTHVVTGVFFLLQATILGLGMVFGLDPTPARLMGYVTALLLGWAAGVTLGHLGKLLSLSAWTWWPAGPRPKQAALYPRPIWLAEAILFAVGVEMLLNGVLRGAEVLTLVGALILVGSALTACVAAAVTLRAGLPALRARAEAA